MSQLRIDLSDSVAVVTGGTRGIGRAITETFAEAGADVVPISRTEEAVEGTVETVEALGGRSLAMPTDVTNDEAVDELFERVADELGGVDILVNNAGINPIEAMGTPEQVDREAFRRTVAVNLEGAFTCTHAAGEYLLADGGAVVNVASTAGVVGVKRQHAYVSTKHGLIGLTKSVALDWAPDVRVNAVAPGYIDTDLTEPIKEMDELYRRIIDRTPIGRFGSPDEVASLVAFLASDLASFITGEWVVADGGITT